MDELADDDAAQAHVRSRVVGAQDRGGWVLLEDLLGIRDPAVVPPDIDPDARRRRLTALVNAASLSRSTPCIYVIEDVQWIDQVSESLLADFLAVVPQTNVAGAHHLSARIPRCAQQDIRCTVVCACAFE